MGENLTQKIVRMDSIWVNYGKILYVTSHKPELRLIKVIKVMLG